MLQHQDPAAVDSSYSASSLRNRKYDQDGNSNFLSPTVTTGNKDDENRNQIRPRSLGPLGRDPPPTNPTANYANVLSPRSRMPCWTTLEPLPEIESGDDGFGRVPPDGAEEGKITEEEARFLMLQCQEKQREKLEAVQQRRRSSLGVRAEEIKQLEDEDEWGDSDSDSEYSERSESMASLNLEGGGAAESVMERWDRVGVGETRASLDKRQSLSGNDYGSLLDEDEDQSSDSDGERGELLDAVWTLRDRERFKAQEMEKHQIQLTMYRRLALIRWVRTLQSRVQEQQNRLQSSFDLILTQRKELLRMGAAANVANMANAANAAPTAVGQS